MDATEQFKELSKESGRRINCRIEMGNTTYNDDKLLRFEFDDITHPNWFTIGTAIANGFTFTVECDETPDVHTEVRPYIRINGSEWFSLGTFYVARRYFRGKYSTFACYDKLYELDVDPDESIPASAYKYSDTLLSAICNYTGLKFSGVCKSYPVFKPEGASIRQIIGHIAALNCACAKIDKNGVLVFKSYSSMPRAVLTAENCFNVTKNITRARISGLRVSTLSEILTYGTKSGLSVIELYCPFMTQDIVDAIGKQLDPLYFYGAEIEMRGLPFLESGDLILFQDIDGSQTPIDISEIQYTYDGELTAKLFSRNKNNSNPVVHRLEFQDALDAIWTYLQRK